jgi:hypothetical protein
MASLQSIPLHIPLAALMFAVAHIGFEYFNGGVKTHHFLAKADMPGFTNWFGLAVLPLLGYVLAIYARRAQGSQPSGVLPPKLALAVVGSLAYGALLSASFHFGAEQVSVVLFAGLLLCAIALPVYRIECIFGFVVGMTITFGSVIPLVIALTFATISFTVRKVAMFVWSSLRER